MEQDPVNRRLELSEQAMRSLGYRVVDMIVEHHRSLPSRSATRRGSRSELERRLREPVPTGPAEPERVLEQLREDVFSCHMTVDHPRFFGFVPSPSNFVSAVADALASGFNPFVGTWLAGSGPAQVELVTVDWLRAVCGLPEPAGGLFVSGGSMANLLALGVARHRMLDDRLEGAVVYCSDQTHHSVERALRVLGLLPDQIRILASDAGYRLDPSALQRALDDDRRAGRRPFCVIANAGTTSTGAVDPLPELAARCRENGLWLHADGAYGAAAALCARGREALVGLELVDSLSLDPHKWLFQPFEIGCTIVRDRRWLEETYTLVPEYMQDTAGVEEEVNFANHGIQLTRSFRALKLWMSMKIFGLEAFARAIEHGIDLAEHAERVLRQSDHWQVVTPAHLAVVTFRFLPAHLAGASAERIDAVTRRIIERMYADGFAMLSTTSLRGRPVLRLCTINPRTTEDDIRATIDRLERFGAESA